MASEIKANKISPATGTALTIGDSGDTLSITGTVSTTGNSTNTGNLDVTGDLTVDTNTLYVDSTNNRVGVGTTGNVGTASARINTVFNGVAEFGAAFKTSYGSAGSTFVQFVNSSGAAQGSIYANATNTTSYNTTSDYRLKSNVAPLTGCIDRLKQLKPSTWTWIQDGSHGEGFLAHEAQEVVSESATGTKDAMRLEEYEITPAVINDEGVETTAAVMGTREVPEYQGIDQSKLVPLLTSALQEAIAKIESLETRVSALEAN